MYLFTILGKVYKGSKDKDSLAKKLKELPLYAVGADLTLSNIESILIHMWISDLIQEDIRTNTKGTNLVPSGKAADLLSGKCKLQYS